MKEVISGINVGVSKEAVEIYRELVMDILNARIDNKTMRFALKATAAALNVQNVVVSNNVVYGGAPARKRKQIIDFDERVGE